MKKSTINRTTLRGILEGVEREVRGAAKAFPPFHSAHEGASVLREEFEELWDEVKVKQSERELERMKSEAIQVAAMAVRFLHDCCDPKGKAYGK